ncbi:MAG TPA: hypothetical protein VN878_00770 [Usitatibacter sp.]|nr:hypothetical protein [Usitatibacter sp.]
MQLRVAGGLLDLAKVMRVLKRHCVSHSKVAIGREGGREIATVHAILDKRRSKRLAVALERLPTVLEAVMFADGDFQVTHYFAQPREALTTITREVQ